MNEWLKAAFSGIAGVVLTLVFTYFNAPVRVVQEPNEVAYQRGYSQGLLDGAAGKESSWPDSGPSEAPPGEEPPESGPPESEPPAPSQTYLTDVKRTEASVSGSTEFNRHYINLGETQTDNYGNTYSHCIADVTINHTPAYVSTSSYQVYFVNKQYKTLSFDISISENFVQYNCSSVVRIYEFNDLESKSLLFESEKITADFTPDSFQRDISDVTNLMIEIDRLGDTRGQGFTIIGNPILS